MQSRQNIRVTARVRRTSLGDVAVSATLYAAGLPQYAETLHLVRLGGQLVDFTNRGEHAHAVRILGTRFPAFA